jgi:hypothetical protein
MSYFRISSPGALPLAMFLILIMFSSNHALQAKDPPSDACVMLPAEQLAKVLEQPFGSPARTVAPAAFAGSPKGTDCTYATGKGLPRKLLFRIYVESSPAAAKETFNKLSALYGPNTAVTGNWDAGYLDARHAIHLQKGKVRYYLNLDPIGTDTTKAERQLKDLATWVAGQL